MLVLGRFGSAQPFSKLRLINYKGFMSVSFILESRDLGRVQSHGCTCWEHRADFLKDLPIYPGMPIQRAQCVTNEVFVLGHKNPSCTPLQSMSFKPSSDF